MARLFALHLALLSFGAAVPAALAQKTPAPPSDKHSNRQAAEQDPPEEDDSQKPKEYTFNPIQAEKELKVGAYYFKKGSYKAAARRFREATRWDPNSAEGFLRLGQAEEKLKDEKALREAYSKYLELAPDAKEAVALRKKLERRRP